MSTIGVATVTSWPEAIAAIFAILVMSVSFIVLNCRARFERSRRRRRRETSSSSSSSSSSITVAFFHPHCSAGGGGERVLWRAIKCLGDLNDDNDDRNISVVVYTTDPPADDYASKLLRHVSDRFSIDLSPSIADALSFVHLVAPPTSKTPRRFSMVAESWDAVRLAWAGLNIVAPDVYVDTTGCAFTFAPARLLAGCRVAAYVHYPTISTDMLSLVWEKRPTYNNDASVAGNTLVTYVKLVYYVAFAVGYGLVGSLSHLTMVNSSWTLGHVESLWRLSSSAIRVVFPPCDTASLEDLPLSRDSREHVILSVGQFRPEKDHRLQLRAFALLLDKLRARQTLLPVRLVLLGSCRGEADEARVRELRELVRKDPRITPPDAVEFVLNQPYSVLRDRLGRASVGIHTMWNEHFGIGVVEMMAAGLVTVAHDSGGPKADIVAVPSGKGEPGRRAGYLASTAEEYADAMYEILVTNGTERNAEIRRTAREAARSFSNEVFDRSFKDAVLSSKILS